MIPGRESDLPPLPDTLQQQLGLKLELAKGQDEFIDAYAHVETTVRTYGSRRN
jgi:hypothetical protein